MTKPQEVILHIVTPVLTIEYHDLIHMVCHNDLGALKQNAPDVFYILYNNLYIHFKTNHNHDTNRRSAEWTTVRGP